MFRKSDSSNKIASILLSGGLMLGMASGSVMADPITSLPSNGNTGNVYGYLAESSVDTYSISLSWGNMKFVYDKGYWTGTQRIRSSNVDGPEAGHQNTETGIWYGMNGTNNLVTITSNSNHSVDVTASVSKTSDETLASALSNTTLTLSGGTTTWTGDANSTSGTTSTTIAAAPEVGAAPQTTLALSVSNAQNTEPGAGLETDLTAETGSLIGTITLNFIPTPAQQP